MDTKKINKNFLIKVSGKTADGYINKLVGVSGLLNLIGIDKAQKFIARAFACDDDVCRCKVYGGIRVSFYYH